MIVANAAGIGGHGSNDAPEGSGFEDQPTVTTTFPPIETPTTQANVDASTADTFE